MNQRGQLMVEFVLSVGMCALILGLTLRLVQAARVQSRLISAARLGALLQSHARVSEATARGEMERVQRASGGGGSELWELATGEYRESGASVFYRLVRARIRARVSGIPISHEVVVQRESAL